jgi:hypothetical protein
MAQALRLLRRMRTKLPISSSALAFILSMALTGCGSVTTSTGSDGAGPFPKGGSQENPSPVKPEDSGPSGILNADSKAGIDLGGGHRLYADTRASGVFYYLPDSFQFEENVDGRPVFRASFENKDGILNIRSKIEISPDLARRILRAKAKHSSAIILPAPVSAVSVMYEIGQEFTTVVDTPAFRRMSGPFERLDLETGIALGEYVESSVNLTDYSLGIVRDLLEPYHRSYYSIQLTGCYSFMTAEVGPTVDRVSSDEQCFSPQNWAWSVQPKPLR